VGIRAPRRAGRGVGARQLNRLINEANVIVGNVPNLQNVAVVVIAPIVGGVVPAPAPGQIRLQNRILRPRRGRRNVFGS
jgi:hypothetical protein